MLRLPEFKEIQFKDLKEITPSSRVILEPLNQMVEYLKEAFNENIGSANLKIQTIELRATSSFEETRVSKEKSGSVYTVQIAQILDDNGEPIDALTQVVWFENGNSIVIKNIIGLGLSTVYNIKLMALYE